MTNISEQDIAILDRYSKAVVHLRDAFRRERFAIGFGIEFTTPIGIPDWDVLFDRVADHPQVMGTNADKPQASPAQRAKLLYDHFAEGNLTGSTKEDETVATMQTEGEWFDILRDCLYRDISQTETLDNHHPYLQSWLPIFQETPLVLNYGIDNGLQMMLGDHAKRDRDGERYWETVYDANLPFSDEICSIYHPYGYLPENVLDGFSDTVMFPNHTSDNISPQENPGQKAMLRYLFNKQTVVLLGVSLDDNPLIRYHLRQNAKQNPGQIHYHIQQSSQSDVSAGHEQPDERFERFNLVTLNLNPDERQSLARLIRCDNTTFQQVADRHDIRIKWVYYITGAPGVGKTSAVNHFRGLITYPEWSKEPPEILKLPFTELDPEQEAEIDRWIAKQYAQRNSRLAAEDEGIFVVDRAPLDPVLFTDDNKIRAKAIWYRNHLNNYESHAEVVPGSVLLLTCDPEVMAARLARRQAAADDPPYLAKLEERGKHIYDLPSVLKISTEKDSVGDVVSAISEHIHHHDYNPAPLGNRLSELQKHDE